jgi:hypothetical protein
MKYAPFLLVLAAAAIFGTSWAAAADLYYWTDENGVRHYSNTGLPDNARHVGTIPEGASPPATVDSGRDHLDDALDSYQSGGADATRDAREAERREQRSERRDREIASERQRLQDEIRAVDNLSIGKSFTLGMKEHRAGLLKRQLALLNSDPARYFDLKRKGELDAFAASGAGETRP